MLLDAAAPERDRTRAAQILGLPLDGRVRVVASVDGRLDVEAVPETATAARGKAAPDLLAVEKAATAAPWVLPTLDLVAGAASLRAAAAALHVHHSTLQERLGQAERLLGWSLREVRGSCGSTSR